MFRFDVLNEQTARTGERAARVVTVIREQPSWITRVALAVAALTFTAVLLLLVIPAMLLATVVFVVLGLGFRAWVWCRSLFGLDRSGRENVRVMTRQ